MNEVEISEVAARWHAAQQTDAMDWAGFTAWLEADPRHREIFDDIALLDEAVDNQRETLLRLRPAEEVPVSKAPVRWRWAFGGAAAAVAALVAVMTIPHGGEAPAPMPAIAWSADRSVREVRIADAGITLAPGSRLSAPSGDRSRLDLSGRAAFDIRHDPTRTLIVSAAGFEIRDVGTRFEVMTGGDMMQVTVAEGEVEIRSQTGTVAPIRLGAGRTAIGTADGRIVTTANRGTALAAWRTGPLIYDNVPLALVAADLTRATGRKVVVDRSVAGRQFSGVLAKADAATMSANVAALTGLETRRQGETIRLGNSARH